MLLCGQIVNLPHSLRPPDVGELTVCGPWHESISGQTLWIGKLESLS